MTNTVNVDLGHRSYDILIGDNLLSSAGDLIKSHLKAPRVAVVTDQNVYDLHGQSLETCLLYTSPSPRDGLLSRMPSSA